MLEARSVFGGVELRAEQAEDGTRQVRGVAVPWGAMSVELWEDRQTGKPVVERFERGAFAKVLEAGEDVVALREHDRGRVLGRRSAGTLRVEETERGLEYEVDLPDTTDGRDLYELVRRGDVRSSSFAFIPTREEWAEEEERVVRTVREVSRLADVSPVTTPAYPDSSVSLRSAQESLDAWRAERETWKAEAEARARSLDLASIA